MKNNNCNQQTMRVTVRPGKNIVMLVLGVLALVISCSFPVSAQVEEHEAKAAFVLKLLNFVEWPAGTVQERLIIGTIGADETSDALQKLVAGKNVNGKQLVVKRMSPDSDVTGCQVLYIGSSQGKNLAALLEKTRNASVLTVGELDGFDQRGGIVNLLVSDSRIRFEVNAHAAERARIQISSRLLSLATIVNGG